MRRVREDRRGRRGHGAGRPPIRSLWIALTAVLVAFGRSAAEDGERELELWLGATWVQPAGPIGEVYGGGPGLAAALALDDGRRIAGSLRAEFFRDRSSPDRPEFVTGAESRLRIVPVSLETVIRLNGAARRPFLVAGVAVWFTDEAFDYSIAGRSYEAGEGATSLAFLLGAGYELADVHRGLRASVRCSLSPVGREVVRRGGLSLSTGETETQALFSLALEAAL